MTMIYLILAALGGFTSGLVVDLWTRRRPAATPTPKPSAPVEWTGRNSVDFRMHPGGFVRLTVTNYDAQARCIMDIDQATAKRFGKALFRACLDREHNESDHL